MILDMAVEPTTAVPDGFFDLTRFLEVGVAYDHVALKHIFWQVGDLGLWAQEGDENFRIGRRFMDAIYQWWDAGWIEMTRARDYDGEPCDFWTAVWSSKHPDNKDFRLVKGWLMIVRAPHE